LAESIEQEAAEEFWLYDDGINNFLSGIRSKYHIVDERPLFKFRELFRKKQNYSVQTINIDLKLLKGPSGKMSMRRGFC
jgi:hypothetical protein